MERAANLSYKNAKRQISVTAAVKSVMSSALPPLRNEHATKLPGKRIASQWNAVSMDDDPDPTQEEIDLQSEVTNLNSQLASLRKAAEEILKDKNHAKTLADTLNEENNELQPIRDLLMKARDKLDIEAEKCRSLKHKLQRYQQSQSGLAGAAAKSRDPDITPESLMQENERLQNDLKGYERSLASKKNQALELEQKTKRKLAKTELLQKKVEELTEGIADKDKEIAVMQDEIGVYKAEGEQIIKEAQTQAEQEFTGKIREEEAKTAALEARLAEIKALLAEKKDAKAEPDIDLDARAQRREARKSEIERVTAALKSTQADDEIAKLKDRLVELGIKRESLESDNFQEEEDDTELTREELLDRITRLRTSTSELQRSASEAETKATEFKETLQNQKSKLEGIRGIVQSLISKRIITGKEPLKL